MASKSAIASMAISHLGIGRRIENLDTERSEEARSCHLFWDECRNATFAAVNWPFATNIVDLQLVESDPNDEWSYSYRYPSETERIVRIVSGNRNDTKQSQVKFHIGTDDTGKLIYTDREDAEAQRIKRVEDTALWPSQFVLAFSYRLAWYIAPRISKGNPFAMKRDMERAWLIEISQAQENALNEEATDEWPEGELIRARNGDTFPGNERDWQGYPGSSVIA